MGNRRMGGQRLAARRKRRKELDLTYQAGDGIKDVLYLQGYKKWWKY